MQYKLYQEYRYAISCLENPSWNCSYTGRTFMWWELEWIPSFGQQLAINEFTLVYSGCLSHHIKIGMFVTVKFVRNSKFKREIAPTLGTWYHVSRNDYQLFQHFWMQSSVTALKSKFNFKKESKYHFSHQMKLLNYDF